MADELSHPEASAVSIDNPRGTRALTLRARQPERSEVSERSVFAHAQNTCLRLKHALYPDWESSKTRKTQGEFAVAAGHRVNPPARRRRRGYRKLRIHNLYKPVLSVPADEVVPNSRLTRSAIRHPGRTRTQLEWYTLSSRYPLPEHASHRRQTRRRAPAGRAGVNRVGSGSGFVHSTARLRDPPVGGFDLVRPLRLRRVR